MLKKIPYLLSVLMLLSSLSYVAESGPPGSPEETESYTLQDICDRLKTGAPGEPKSFEGPTSSPENTETTCTIKKIMEELLPSLDNDRGAKPEEVVKDKRYWGLTNGKWGIQTGTKTTETSCEMHGNRWCDNQNGTVTDVETGLVWLRDASWGRYHPFACRQGQSCKTIFDRVKELKDGVVLSGNMVLKDGSKSGDWRIPTKDELDSLANGTEKVRSNEMRAFIGVRASRYWSCTKRADGTSYAWFVGLGNGGVNAFDQGSPYYVWPVRSRQ